MKIFTPIPEKLKQMILTYDNFIVCGHLSPDGDCANSVMTLGLLLEKLNKNFILVNEGNFERPEIAGFRERLSEKIPENFINNKTLGIIADCSTYDRLGIYADIFRKLTCIVIDHHSNGFAPDETRYIIPKSPSTTLLVYKLYKELNIEVSPECAQLIFRGFATDSGFFKFLSSGTEECFEIVADLVKTGVNPSEEYSFISGNKPVGNLKFLGKLIERAESFFDGRVFVTYEEPSDSEDFGDNAHPADEFYANALSIEGVEAVIFFKKSKKTADAIEVGLRASYNSKINVGQIASDRGGGGHVKAAGVTVKGSLSEVKQLILSDFKKVIDALY